MTIHLGRLALDALAGIEELGAAGPAERLERAIRVYLEDGEGQRPGWSYQDFAGGRPAEEGAALDLAIDADLWNAFNAEAERQGASVDQLATHAALYLAAEVAAGRIVLRMVDGIEPPEGASA